MISPSKPLTSIRSTWEMLSQSQVPIQPLEAHQNTLAIKPFQNNKQFVQTQRQYTKKAILRLQKTSYTPPSFCHQKISLSNLTKQIPEDQPKNL